LTNKGETNEENPFECPGSGNADGARYGTVISGLLLPSLLSALLLGALGATTPARNPNPLLPSRGDHLTKFNPEPGNLDDEARRLCSGYV
jgi:hypothetical protein